MKRTTVLKHTWLLVGLLFAALSGCDPAPPRQGQAIPPLAVAAAEQAGLERVTEPSLVCMVNDIYMGRAQIPVEVNGRTYFGCCPDCKNRLHNDPAVRAAADPVTGEAVDKAAAVIARDPEGRILYFASEATYRRYPARR